MTEDTDETADRSVADRIALAGRAARAGGEVATSYFRTAMEVREKEGAMDPVTVADTETQERVVAELREAGDTAPVVGEEGDARKTVPDAGRAWVIDPIDGTTNFARGARSWGVCVALVEDREPVGGVTHLPALGDTYVAGPVGTTDDERARITTTRNGEPVSTTDKGDPGELVVAPVFHLHERDREQYRTVTAASLDAFGDVRALGSGQTALATLASGGIDAVVSTAPISPWDSICGVALVRGAGGRVTTLDGERWRPGDGSLIATNGACHEVVRGTVRDAVRGDG